MTRKLSITAKKNQASRSRDIKGRCRIQKKSANQGIDETQSRIEFYKSFIDTKSSQEVSKLVEKDLARFSNKDTNLNLLHESKLPEKTVGTEEPAGLKLGYVKSIPSRMTRLPIAEEDEELLTPDFTAKLEKSKSYIDPKRDQKSPIHFINAMPPGLTPNRYSTKTYGSEDFSQAMAANHDSKIKDKGTGGHLDEDAHQFNASKPRAGGRTLSLTIQSEEFRKNHGNFGPIPENEGNPQGLMKNPTPEKKKPVIIDESHERYTGRLKFFDESKSYGFIVMDDDGSDIFVHYDDLHKANITKEFLKSSKFGNSIRLSFSCLEYIGKYNKSRKATDVQFMN